MLKRLKTKGPLSWILSCFFLLSLACNSKLIVTVSDGGVGRAPSIESMSPIIAQEGEVIRFKGQGLRSNLRARINGVSVPLSVSNINEGQIEMPASKAGLKKLEFLARGQVLASFDFIADTAGDELPVIPLTPAEVCKNLSYRDANGDLQSGTMICADTDVAYCNFDGSKGCVTSDALPAISIAELTPELGKVHETISLAGVYGTMKDCSNSNQIQCYVNPNLSMQAIIGTEIDSTKILGSYTALGVVGNIGNCSIPGTTSCFATGSYFAAQNCIADGSGCYLPPYQASTQDLKAVNVDSIVASVIKKDEIVAGVTGSYPSVTAPLATGDALSDLTSVNFEASLQSASSVGWFDKAGNRLSHAGDTAFVAANIKAPTNIFNVVGTQAVPAVWDVRLAAGFGNSESGRMKTLCSNRSNLVLWNIAAPPILLSSSMTTDPVLDTIDVPAHGLATGDAVHIDYFGSLTAPSPLVSTAVYYAIWITNDKFQLAIDHTNAMALIPIDITAAGSFVTPYKTGSVTNSSFNTIDDANNSSAMTSMTSWTSATQVCEGVEVTLDDTNIWKDVSIGSCASSPANCRMKDKISELEWSPLITTLASSQGPWARAIAACDALTLDTKTDWRLPSQKELLAAYVHGIRSAASASWIIDADFSNAFWAATTHSFLSTEGWSTKLSTGETKAEAKTLVRKVLCVRDP